MAEKRVESRAEQRRARRGVGSKKEATTRKIVNMLQHQEGGRGRRERERDRQIASEYETERKRSKGGKRG